MKLSTEKLHESHVKHEVTTYYQKNFIKQWHISVVKFLPKQFDNVQQFRFPLQDVLLSPKGFGTNNLSRVNLEGKEETQESFQSHSFM